MWIRVLTTIHVLTTAGLYIGKISKKVIKKLVYATRNLGYVQFIMWTDYMMRLSCLSEQLVRSWEQLVLKDTKKGFIMPWPNVV